MQQLVADSVARQIEGRIFLFRKSFPKKWPSLLHQ